METILITRDTKGKIRVIEIAYSWNQTLNSFVIERFTYQFGGKKVSQPPIFVSRGKSTRTTQQQVDLEYNSLIKKYKDKGYRSITDFGYTSIDDFNPDEVFPKDVVDQSGVVKPMLCKVYDPNDKKNEGITWYISRKHDGVRCMIYYKDGIVRTASRGGQDYDIPATYICSDSFVMQLFESNPNLVLDGELYIHGRPLSYVSGLCRLETLEDRHLDLKFHCYDVVDETKTFKERFDILQDINNKNTSERLVIVEHILINSPEEIDTYHDAFVAEGYEGAVIRDADAKYKPGARNRTMQKIKRFTDDEYEVIGLAEGLRDEDMCFVMKTKEGYEFKAKPIGDRKLKQWYREHIKELIGQFGTVKHFGMTTTSEPVPNLPVFKNFRDVKDM